MNIINIFIGVGVFYILQHDGCCYTLSDKILCEHSDLEIECPNQSLITTVIVTLPNSTSNENVCTTPASSKEGVTIIEPCIGKRSCRILSTDMDFSQIPDQTWRLKVNYTCEGYNRTRIICPKDLQDVECIFPRRFVDIGSVHQEKSHAICMQKDEGWCADIIENRTKEMCNGQPYCFHLENKVHKFIRQQLHVQQVAESDWNTCIRIPKYFNVSFSCTDAVKGTLSEKEKSPLSEITGISVGVSAGIIIIVLVSLVLIRRFKSKRNSQPVIYENTTGLGKTNETATNDAQGNYVSLQQSRDVPNYAKLKNVRPGLNLTNDAQESYTLLEQTKDVTHYAELKNVTPALNLTNDHNYMEVI